MKRLLLVVSAAVAVAIVPSASAGGWATVGLSSLPPAGLQAKQSWPVLITVLQHGRTPLEGVTPVLTVRDEDGREVGSFKGAPAGKPGVYRAVVRFPATGTYSYEVYDGFETYGGARTHTFKPVQIGEPGSGSFPVGAALALALMLAAVSTLVLRRRSQPATATELKEAA